MEEEKIEKEQYIRFNYNSIFGKGELVGIVEDVIDNDTFKIYCPIGILTIKRTDIIKIDAVDFAKNNVA